MWKIICYATAQSLLLAGGQVFLKFALEKMRPFGMDWDFWGSLLMNWQFAVCGLLFGGSSILWMYIVKTFPLSVAYPMISLSYVFGMLAAVFVFHEEIPINRWAGVALIVGGCCLIAK